MSKKWLINVSKESDMINATLNNGKSLKEILFGVWDIGEEGGMWTITRAKFFIEKETPKAYKNDMNLLIFLDLIYKPCKNFKCHSLQVQNVQIFPIFTYSQSKIFLILPITRAAHVCLVSTGSCTRKVRKVSSLCFKLLGKAKNMLNSN